MSYLKFIAPKIELNRTLSHCIQVENRAIMEEKQTQRFVQRLIMTHSYSLLLSDV